MLLTMDNRSCELRIRSQTLYLLIERRMRQRSTIESFVTTSISTWGAYRDECSDIYPSTSPKYVCAGLLDATSRRRCVEREFSQFFIGNRESIRFRSNRVERRASRKPTFVRAVGEEGASRLPFVPGLMARISLCCVYTDARENARVIQRVAVRPDDSVC